MGIATGVASNAPTFLQNQLEARLSPYTLIQMQSNNHQLQRSTDNLLKGRVSMPGARYFITCNALRPQTRLIEQPASQTIIETFRFLADSGDIQPLCSVIMPDHIHLLAVLTGRLTVGQAVGKLKALTRQILSHEGIAWQRNFFEHRLRPKELSNNFARYIFLNPYRAGLINQSQTWPLWILGSGTDFDFLHHLSQGLFPPHEWIDSDLKSLDLNLDIVGPD